MTQAATSEVCIIGAGIAGLNALVVATKYLSKADRVLLVDSRPRVGGMWVDTYDYVRLHQPHPIFTAGDIKWKLDRPPEHLATKPEILGHLQHCLDTASKRVQVDPEFGWDYLSHEERDGVVQVTLRSPSGQTKLVTTKRLIKAFGHRVMPNSPLQVSSARVHSVTPESLDLSAAGLGRDNNPVWIVGSGKTAMDTAHLLVTAFPRREVNMLAGPGTMFARRETFFPVGSRRWWAGTPINTMVREVAQRFDGTNEVSVGDWFRSRYGIAPTAHATNFFNGYLSDRELKVIVEGLRRIEEDYFVDAVDRGDEVDLVLRTGERRCVPPGTWLVNCTGSLLREQYPYEPFVSATGNVLSIQMRSSATGPFSSFAGYFLTHLMFRGKLTGAGLYELDVEELHRKAKHVVIYTSMTQSMHNLGIIADTLPKKVIMDCGLDYDRWYPLPRQLVGATEFLRTYRGDRAHHQATLATIGERFGVRSGPL